ncbi:MAG: spore germination protein GerW family protein [Gammaproteobacteria bacterium]|jgi:uncharacterized spore protein YtfJ
MEEIEKFFEKSVSEIERMLNTKTVVGDPITIGKNTLIPLVSVGFGFGVGAGEGTEPQKGAGKGGGAGGGGGVKPVAILIVNDEGVRLEPIKSGTTSILEKVAETIGKSASSKNEPATD